MGSINKCEIIDGQKVLTPFVQTNSIEEYYSTEEEATNKVWIDGKRIYRRVLVTIEAFDIGDKWYNITYYCGSPVLDIDVLVHAEFLVERGVYIIKHDKDTIYIGRPTSQRTIPVGSMMVIEYTKV